MYLSRKSIFLQQEYIYLENEHAIFPTFPSQSKI